MITRYLRQPGRGTEAPEIQRLNMAASRNVRTRIRLESEENYAVVR